MDIEEIMSDTDAHRLGILWITQGSIWIMKIHTVIDVADDISGNELTDDDKKNSRFEKK